MFIPLRRWSDTVRLMGDSMSSTQIAPKVGPSAMTVSMISKGSWVSRQIGRASTPANVLKITDLPSMTGRAASGPTLPRPKIDDPLVTIATVLPRQVTSKDAAGSRVMTRQGSATPGV
jgi:hypothetical protein